MHMRGTGRGLDVTACRETCRVLAALALAVRDFADGGGK
jgi:hypothetical protein